MEVSGVRFLEREGKVANEQFPVVERSVDQLDLWREFHDRPTGAAGRDAGNGQRPVSQVIMRLETDADIQGLSAASRGVIPTIRRLVERFLLGRDPHETERLWQIMVRSDR